MHFQSPSMASIVTQSQLPARIPRKQAICTQLEDVQQRDFRATKWMGTLQKVERNQNAKASIVQVIVGLHCASSM